MDKNQNNVVLEPSEISNVNPNQIEPSIGKGGWILGGTAVVSGLFGAGAYWLCDKLTKKAKKKKAKAKKAKKAKKEEDEEEVDLDNMEIDEVEDIEE